MRIVETPLFGPVQGVLATPERPTGLGLLILTGASGRVDVERARLFAERGVTTLAQRWFGGEGQSPGICEIPLETFMAGLDSLADADCERFAILGVSKGAEAALLTAVHDVRVDAVCAFSPSSVVWQQAGPGYDGGLWPVRSSWTLAGRPLPFVAHDPRWRPAPGGGPIRYRSLHEQSLATFAEDIAAATIPIERARAEVLVVAGAEDALWPSDSFALDLAERCWAQDRPVTWIEHPGAGHRAILPGEAALAEPPERAWGGSEASDRELGLAAWRELTGLLGLTKGVDLHA